MENELMKLIDDMTNDLTTSIDRRVDQLEKVTDEILSDIKLVTDLKTRLKSENAIVVSIETAKTLSKLNLDFDMSNRVISVDNNNQLTEILARCNSALAAVEENMSQTKKDKENLLSMYNFIKGNTGYREKTMDSKIREAYNGIKKSTDDAINNAERLLTSLNKLKQSLNSFDMDADDVDYKEALDITDSTIAPLISEVKETLDNVIENIAEL